MKKSIDRREALRCLGAGAAAGALLPGFAAGACRRPNIIFILTDDHRWDAFGFMDKPWLPTPHLDRIAREGAHFKNSFVTTSLCSPSRASFLTGQYANRHGVKNNLTPWREESVTFLETLKSAGYRTGFIGKWHMPGNLPDLTGQGKLDRMVTFTIAGGQGIYHDCPMVVDGEKVETRGYITDTLTDYAMDFLRNAQDGPFCLYLSHKAAHDQFAPAPRHRGRLAGMPFHKMEKGPVDLPDGLVCARHHLMFEKYQQGYYEALLGVDESVGRVLDFLDGHGLAEDTVVVYAGDNGFLWGEHGLVDKRYAYEESIRIPHLMRYPRAIPAGAKVDEMVLNIDLAPTLLEAAGLEIPSRAQGRSCLPLFSGQNPDWRRSFLYEYFKDPGFPHPEIRAVRAPDWKLITYPGSRRFKDELYHLSEDPRERRNLAGDPAFADQARRLGEELARLGEEYGR